MLEDAKVMLTLSDFDRLRNGNENFIKLAKQISDCCSIDDTDYTAKLKSFDEKIEKFMKSNDPLENFPIIEDYTIRVHVDINKLDKVIRKFCTYGEGFDLDDERVEIEYRKVELCTANGR